MKRKTSLLTLGLMLLTPALAGGAGAPRPAPTPVPVVTPAPAPVKPAPVAPAPAPVMPAPVSTPIVIPALPLSGGTVGTTTQTGTQTGTQSSTTTNTTVETNTTATTETTTVATDTLYDVLVTDDRFSTLRDLLSDAGLTETLMTGEYTIFAPTDEAFAAVDEEQLAVLASDPELLKRVLSYHVVSGKVAADAQNLTTVEGSALVLGDATVDATALNASNGTIYAIDRVLLPEGLVIDTTPTTEISTETTASSTTVTTTTTTATGATTTATVTATAAPLAVTISQDPRFSTLSSLITAAGLTDTLSSGDFTVFAPTNEAFAKISAADLTALRGDTTRLRALLLGHVIASRLTDTNLSTTPTLKTAQGNDLTLTTNGSTIRVGNATVLGKTEIGSSNGVIVPIDTVLMLP